MGEITQEEVSLQDSALKNSFPMDTKPTSDIDVSGEEGEMIELMDDFCFSRDDLLEIAEYLNMFQSLYLEQGVSLGTISYDDLREICLHYRKQKKTQEQVDDRSDQEEKSPKKLEFRLDCIDKLWRRVDVWNAKALAQQLLITPEKVAEEFLQSRKLGASISRASDKAIRKSDYAEQDSDDGSYVVDPQEEEGETSEEDDDANRTEQGIVKQQSSGPASRGKTQSSVNCGPLTRDELVFFNSHMYFSTLLCLPLSSYTQVVLPIVKTLPSNPNPNDLPPLAQHVYVQRQKLISTTDGTNSNGNSSSENDTPLCLSLPPNYFTWPYFHEITSVLQNLPDSLLPSVYTSPCVGNLQIGLGVTRTPRKIQRSIYSTTMRFRKSDLVALWIRAQRNFQAKRHFLQLFKYVEEGGKLKAVFKGNHKHIWSKSIRSSRPVMHLQKWAVTNQILVSGPLIQKLFQSDDNTSGQERPLPPPEYFKHGRKRRRLEPEDNAAGANAGDGSLVQSAYASLLRSWARMYERQLAPLFFSSEDQASALDKAGMFPTLSEYGWTAQSIGFVLEYIKKHMISSDRNLVRIDRRIALGKYEQAGAFETQLKDLLGTFEAAERDRGITDTGRRFSDLQNAIVEPLREFESMKASLGPLRAATRLVAVDEKGAEADGNFSVKNVLDSIPTPWVDRCQLCKKPPNAEPRTDSHANTNSGLFSRCHACHRVFHLSCEPGVYTEKTILRFIENFPPLRELFTVRFPQGPTKDAVGRPVIFPNYCDAGAKEKIVWTTLELIIKREPEVVQGERKLSSFGLGLSHAIACNQAMTELLIGETLVWKLDDYKLKKRAFLTLPFEHGLVVHSVTEGPAKRAGLQKNDVVTGLEYVRFLDEGSKESQVVRKYNFEDVDAKDRFALFACPVTELKVLVRRPSVPVYCQAEALYEHLERIYDVERKVTAKSDKPMWFCAKCSQPPLLKHQSTLLWEARCCRAVIRYLATQWYASSVWFEPLLPVENLADLESDNLHSKCASLLRLDLMMDGLLNKLDYFDSCSSSAYYGFTIDSKRLGWAPEELESNPLTLLCRGVGRLVKLIQDESVKESFLADFCRLFCAWCLSCCRHVDRRHTSGPYLHALHAPRPFPEAQLCQHCLVREVRQGSSEDCDMCAQVQSLKAKASPSGLSSVKAKEKEQYELSAGFVGKILLLLPSNPLLRRIAAQLQVFKIMVDLENPLELLVASFIPISLTEKQADAANEKPFSGVFHLVPLVDEKQVSNLVSRAKARKSEPKFDIEVAELWSKDGLLDLEGVLQMSYEEVAELARSTVSISQAADAEVSRQTKCVCRTAGPAALPPSRCNFSAVVWASEAVDETNHGKDHGSDFDPFVCSIANCLSLERLDLNTILPSPADHRLRILDDFANFSNLALSQILRDRGLPSIDCSDNGEESLRYVQQTFLTRVSEPRSYLAVPIQGQDARCAMVYTDLYFREKSELDAFLRENPVPSSCPKHVPETSTVILTRRQSAELPELGGWGMELYRWNQVDSTLLTVGRINPAGDAYASGLRTDDCVIALNALPVSSLIDPVSLGCALLGVSFLVDASALSGYMAAGRLLQLAATHGIHDVSLVATIRRKIKDEPRRGFVGSTTMEENAASHFEITQEPALQKAPATEVIGITPADHDTEHEAIKMVIPQENDLLLQGCRTGRLLRAPSLFVRRFVVNTVLQAVAANPRPDIDDITTRVYSDSKNHFKALVKVRVGHTERWTISDDAAALKVFRRTVESVLSRWARQKVEHQLQRDRELELAKKRQQERELAEKYRKATEQTRQEQALVVPGTFVQQPWHVPAKILTDTQFDPIIRSISSLGAFGTAPELTRADLDRQGPEPLVLTIAELSMLLTSIRKEMMMLGVKLLMPRYSKNIIVDQLTKLKQLDVGIVKSLPFQAWEFFVQADFQRSLLEPENAPFLFQDIKSGNFYKLPVVRCSIDRLIEAFFRIREGMQTTNEFMAGFANDARMEFRLLRIRGGGGPGTLNHLPLSKWHDTLVSGSGTTTKGEETQFIGRVVMKDLDANVEPYKVQVACFCLGGSPTEHRFECQKRPKNLSLVLPGSAEYDLAISAEKFLRGNETKHVSIQAVAPPEETRQTGENATASLGLNIATQSSNNAGSTAKGPGEFTAAPLEIFRAKNIGLANLEQPCARDVPRLPVASHIEREAEGEDPRDPLLFVGRDQDEFFLSENLSEPDQGTVLPACLPQAEKTKDLGQTRGATVGSRASDLTGAPRDSTRNVLARTENPEHMDNLGAGTFFQENELLALLGLDDSPRKSSGLLGVLPDGRSIRWFLSDPQALYVDSWSVIDTSALTHQSSEYKRLVHSNFLRHACGGRLCPTQASFPCVWGCKTDTANGAQKQSVGFQTVEELLKHLETDHTFSACTGSDKASVFESKVMLVRLSGSSIISLVESMTVAVCAMCPSLIPLSVITREGNIRFVTKRLLSEFARGDIANEYNNLSAQQRPLLALVFEIWRLFPVNEYGIMENMWGVEKDVRGSGNLWNERSICNLGSESILVCNDYGHCGIGCNQIGTLLYGDSPGFCEGCQARPSQETWLPKIRDRLLEMISSIPRSFLVSSIDSLPDFDSEAQITWKDSLRRASSKDVVFQCLAVLLSYVDQKKFPYWWKDEGLGWIIFQQFLSDVSLPGLFMQMYVFDLALSEAINICASEPVWFLTGGDYGDYCPSELKAMEFSERCSLAIKRAKEHGVPIWAGDHDIFCSVCQDGGEIFCCELCPNTAHQACYDLSEPPDDFVCHSCIDDMDVMVQSFI